MTQREILKGDCVSRAVFKVVSNYERDIDILIPNSTTVRFSEFSGKDDTDKEFVNFEVPPSQESEWNSKSKNKPRQNICGL